MSANNVSVTLDGSDLDEARALHALGQLVADMFADGFTWRDLSRAIDDVTKNPPPALGLSRAFAVWEARFTALGGVWNCDDNGHFWARI